MIALLVALALLAGPAQAATPLSPTEQRAILRHGPWPQPWDGDASNRVSGNPAAIAYGRQLFFDPRLSGLGGQSCASCHRPELAWSDGLPTGQAAGRLDRNTPGLLDVRLQRWFGWDGAQDSLWAQSLRPLLDPREMAGSTAHLGALVRGDATLACGYRQAFGSAPPPSEEALTVDLAKALAAFQETLTTGRSPFDDFRDALAAGDEAAAARFPVAARRGAALFVGKGQCSTCHAGPGFTNREFHDIGLPHFAAPGRVDPGRHGGIVALQTSPYTRLGPFNDAPARADGMLTRQVTPQHRNWGEFRVPSLRNVALTAPYMHNGSLPTLHAVVRYYSEIDEERLHADGERLLRPLGLSNGEVDDVVAFLESLTGQAKPLPAATLPDCR